MLNKFYCVLFLYLISIVLLNSQEAYNRYYYKSLISSEDMRNGILNNQTESEKKWVKDWRQQLKDKANLFKKRTGFEGNINFHNDRFSLDGMFGKFDCILVVDTTTAIISSNQILDEIIDLINVPRNQLKRTMVNFLEHTNIVQWSVSYNQYVNGIEVLATGSAIVFKKDGSLKKCRFNFYPDLSTDIYSQFTENQIEERIRKEYDLSDGMTFKHGKYYYRVGKFGELSLFYETYYNSYYKTVYHPTYKVIFNALTGDIEYHSNSGIP